MEHLLEESVSSADLKRFETRYHEEMAAGKPSPSAQFENAIGYGARFSSSFCASSK